MEVKHTQLQAKLIKICVTDLAVCMKDEKAARKI
jgi:hypothetical protein